MTRSLAIEAKEVILKKDRDASTPSKSANESISAALEEAEASGILHTSFISEATIVPSEVFISWVVSVRG